MRKRSLVGAAVAAGSLAVGIAAAAQTSSPVSFGLSVESRTLSYGGRASRMTVTMRTGQKAQTVGLRFSQSQWPDPQVQGATVSLTHRKVTGPGRITSIGTPGGGGSFAGASVCQRGGDYLGDYSYDFSLPASSTTTVSYDVRLAAPPWVKTPVSVSVVAGIPASAPDPATEIKEYRLGTERFYLAGPTGVRITLTAKAPKPRKGRPYQTVKAGHGIEIDATTIPALSGQPIELSFASTTTSARGPIGRAITSRQGRLSLRWVPKRRGIFTIRASYRHPAAGVLADSACDLALQVT